MYNQSRIGQRLRAKYYRTRCNIDTGVIIHNPENFRAELDSSLYHACYVLNTQGRFSMGRRSHLGAFCYVNAALGQVTIGDDVAIGPGTRIIAHSNHFESGKKVTEVRATADINIGNNVFIGANCTITPGTTIGDNVVVGAGAVVKGNLKENSIYAGVPCKLVRSGWYEQS